MLGLSLLRGCQYDTISVLLHHTKVIYEVIKLVAINVIRIFAMHAVEDLSSSFDKVLKV